MRRGEKNPRQALAGAGRAEVRAFELYLAHGSLRPHHDVGLAALPRVGLEVPAEDPDLVPSPDFDPNSEVALDRRLE